MAPFFKKNDVSKIIRVIYYEGNLPSFGANLPCQILLDDVILQITKVNPSVTVKLAIDKIQGIDIYLSESEYMLKYHGHATSTSKTSGIEKIYFTINYDKDGTTTYLCFWCTAMEIGAIKKLLDDLLKDRKAIEISL